MAASAVRVDRVAEGDGGFRADFVDDRPGAHVEELEPAELAGADLAVGHVEQRRLRRILVVVGELPPELSFRHGPKPIEQVFDNARGNWVLTVENVCSTVRVMPPANR